MKTGSNGEFQQLELKPLQDSIYSAVFEILSTHSHITAIGEDLKKDFIRELAGKMASDFFGKSYDYLKKQQRLEAERIAQESAEFRIKHLQAMRSISDADLKAKVLQNLDALVGERNAGKKYLMDEYVKSSFEILLRYFHPGSFLPQPFDRNKGICLLGPVGTGKSTLLAAFKDNPMASFRIYKAQDIVDSYVKDPERTMNKILTEAPISEEQNEFGFTQYEILIEEVGREQLSVIPKGAGYQSTPVNVMERVIMELYDKPNVRIHMISNAEIKGNEVYEDKLSALYGEAAASRIYDMFNVITQDSKAPNRRGNF
ncbi:AAA family ATPase [Emticicia sp. BO119]|uniref:AAA family ATPase n=1 Tax=Emticicia sp. BO119 TaxID=2757768 RepID=UPI0015F0CD7D|nr:AAA family ATPase [Emticicia sp. BO119]MBA4852044.1 AAA family ATPase [Emticicia sp. BO119]